MAYVPHPFPYQGSKRRIAKYILPHFPGEVDRLIEPFCGSAAVTLAAASRWQARRFWINDSNQSLMELWSEILGHPRRLADDYRELWNAQRADPKAYFYRVRDDFNREPKPHLFLYLLARIVKGSIRYGRNGNFNQSPDNRRLGMHPEKMTEQLISTSNLMRRRCKATSCDFREAVERAESNDLVYMDPPYQGTSESGDPRYHRGLAFNEFVDALDDMNYRDISYIVSYDGWTGDKQHGSLLPNDLDLTRIAIDAGRSTQSTLLGGDDRTVESLYLSVALGKRLADASGAVLMFG